MTRRSLSELGNRILNMFSDADKDAIRRSWRLIVPIADTAADVFYRRLFELAPDYRRLFPDDLTEQKRKLVHLLAFVVRSLDFEDADWRSDVRPEEDLLLVVLALGRRHADLYQIAPATYATVGDALFNALEYSMGPAFTDDVRAAWTRVYTALVQTMQMGATAIDRETALASPEWITRLGEQALSAQRTAAGLDESAIKYAQGSP